MTNNEPFTIDNAATIAWLGLLRCRYFRVGSLLQRCYVSTISIIRLTQR